jgi:hypothetical protein
MKSAVNAVKMSMMMAAMFAIVMLPTFATANHSWGGYHWARKSNPFTVQLGDTLTTNWESYLATSIIDWNKSAVLDTVKVAGNGTAPRKCSPSSGKVEICNEKYGQNGWLGIASVWTNGMHIVQGTVKMNDTYYAMSRYNTPAWRNMVMCQEIGHTFGLAHQDEGFSNTNLGTCMDYTNDPSGKAGTNGSGNNEHPNQHDYDMLVSIYNHNDTFSSVFSSSGATAGSDIDTNDPRNWGQAVAANKSGEAIMFRRDLGHDNEMWTFVFWAREQNENRPEDGH